MQISSAGGYTAREDSMCFNRRFSRYLLLVTLAVTTVAAILPVAADVGGDHHGDFFHEVFRVDDGLPRAGINVVLPARDGFLWLATFDGLVRFDGVRFETFRNNRFPVLGGNRIQSLLEARDGALWIRTEQGHLSRRTGDGWTACGHGLDGGYSCSLTTGISEFFGLHEDPLGRVWMTHGNSLITLAPNATRPEVIPWPSERGRVNRIFSDTLGRLWLSSASTFFRGRWDVPEPPGLPVEIDLGVAGDVESLEVDDRGEVWISTGRPKQIGRVRGERFEPDYEPAGRVASDPSGAVWIADDQRLLRSLDGELEEVATEQPSSLTPRNFARGAQDTLWMSQGKVLLRDGEPLLRLKGALSFSSLVVDRAGTIWAATAGGELHALHPRRVETLTAGLSKGVILYPVYEDHDGTIWTGNYFLARRAPNATRFKMIDELASGVDIRSLLRDRHGTFWVGTGQGLFTFDELPTIDDPEGNPRIVNPILALTESRDGTLWAGTGSGLMRRDPKSDRWIPVIGTDGSRAPRLVRVVREGVDDSIWLGTNGSGAARWDGVRFHVIDRDQGLASNQVRAIWIAPGPEDFVWIGTEDLGLSRLTSAGTRVASVGYDRGLYSDGIHQIVDDLRGNLWMSSNDGIFRVRRDELEAVADGRAERVLSVAYTERDGLADREANGGVQQAGLRDRQGRILFPTMGGLARLDPEELLRPPQPLEVLIQAVRVHEMRLIPTDGALPLTPQQRSFTVEFTAPYFHAPERLRFRYRLLPYDEHWLDPGTLREAPFTKVPPGRYTFEVAVLHEDVWSEPAAIELVAAARFFETRWFRGSMLALALTLVVFAFWWRERHAQLRRRQLEETVRERTATISEQARKLQRLDEMKSQFFANVSHELRTPLTLVLGPAQDLLGGESGQVDEQAAEQIRVIGDNAERLLGLVDQLLDVARLEGGGLKLRLRRLDLGAFLSERIEAITALGERLGVRIMHHHPGRPVEITADPAQLGKVFDNLLANALKFSPRGDAIHVVLDDAPEEEVLVHVRDHGPGIPENRLEKIFERFYQVEHNEERPGAGLGLALARQLTELHFGRIEAANSSEGGGACMTVTLRRGIAHFDRDLITDELLASFAPAEPAPTPAPEPPVEPARLSSRARVLIVDDNAEIRAYLRRHLRKTYDLVEAKNGAEALELSRQYQLDLVISDIMMPGIDGAELLRTLRDDPRTARIPVILVTAKASSESRLMGLREGADDYLVKPFDPRELTARAANLIAVRKQAGEPRGLKIDEIEATSADKMFLEKVKTAIEARLGDRDFTVGELAVAVGFERSHLLRRLRALTGESPSAMIRSMRLQRAAQLLRASSATVSEIAYEVGFKNVSHFSRAFSKHFGRSPSAYGEDR